MATKDPAKIRAARLKYRAKKHAEKFGEDAGDRRGKHGNHASGEDHPRWNRDELITSHGYVAVKVAIDHPHGWGPPGLKNHRYAYKHIVVMMEIIGRPLAENEVVHHRNGVRTENTKSNLKLETRSGHAREHGNSPTARDFTGKFKAGVSRPTE